MRIFRNRHPAASLKHFAARVQAKISDTGNTESLFIIFVSGMGR
ncbi:unknown protein [Cronobacter turicensis z3032]|uniref:Uncharacterized protein n=1 Tax=Cronobacter turicensis (strain DSM 18703 / CCUG 55852 / LMG 23827 / z3032) TaxID=693216 RepID=C9Y2X4_CROTZ|nr:unknown protein [Cronobacter turicensis z3032]